MMKLMGRDGRKGGRSRIPSILALCAAAALATGCPPVCKLELASGQADAVDPGSLVHLDGSGSAPPTGLVYDWRFVAAPEPDPQFEPFADPSKRTFRANVAGLYSVLLTVTANGLSDECDQPVSVYASLPPALNGPIPMPARIAAGREVAFTVSATNPEPDETLCFTVAPNTQGGSDPDRYILIDCATGAFRAKPGEPPIPAPELGIPEQGPIAFTFTATDSRRRSDSETVQATVIGSPLANAGPDQPNVAAGALVQLDGARSRNIRNPSLTDLPLNPTWTFLSKPPGSGATIAGATTSLTPTFTADLPGQYVVGLVVDNTYLTSQGDQTIVTAGAPPAADAGSDRTVAMGTVVALDGSGSSDPQGRPLSFAWSFAQRPAGSAAAFSPDAQAVQPSFQADVPGVFTARLAVTNTAGLSDEDDATIVSVGPPQADAGPDRNADFGSVVQLSGNGIPDVTGQPIASYAWRFASRPSGSAAAFSPVPSAQNPAFTADKPGDYVVGLVVGNGYLESAEDLATIHVLPAEPPTARIQVLNLAGPPYAAEVGASVLLSGGQSSDPAGAPLTFSWRLLRPSGGFAVLFGRATPLPNFAPDVPGAFGVELTVSNGRFSDTETVSIAASPAEGPVADAGPAREARVGSLVSLSGAGSSDPSGLPLSFAWILADPQGADATGSLAGAGTAAPSFAPAAPGEYKATLVVNNGYEASPPDVVSIFAKPAAAPVANAGADQIVATGATAVLSAAASSDPSGLPLSYSWEIAQKPQGSEAFIPDRTAAQPHFIADRSGVYLAKLTVDNGFDQDDDAVQVTADRAPFFNPPMNGANRLLRSPSPLRAGEALAFQVSAGDEDGDPLTFSIAPASPSTTLPAGMAISQTGAGTAALEWPSAVAGSYGAAVTVTDGKIPLARTVDVIVLDANKAVARIGEDRSYDRGCFGSALALDGSNSLLPAAPAATPFFQWYKTAPSDGSSLLTYAATQNATFNLQTDGTHRFVLAIDTDGVRDPLNIATFDSRDAMTLTVDSPAPAFDPVAPVVVTVGDPVKAVEVDASNKGCTEALTFAAVSDLSAPALQGISFDPNASPRPTLTIDPDPNAPQPLQPGEYLVSLSVEDLLGQKGYVSVPIVVLGGNEAPVFAAIPDLTVRKDMAPVRELVVNASDPNPSDDDAVLFYSAENAAAPGTLPASFSFSDATRALTVDPFQAGVGDYAIKFRVEDRPDGDPDQRFDEETIAVAVAPDNAAPIFDPIPDRVVAVGGSATLNLADYARDPDGDVLAFAVAPASYRGAALDPATGVFTFSPGFGQQGATTFTFAANDGALSALRDATIAAVDPGAVGAVAVTSPADGSTVPGRNLTVGGYAVLAEDMDASGAVVSVRPQGGGAAIQTSFLFPGGAKFDVVPFSASLPAPLPAAGAYALSVALTPSLGAETAFTYDGADARVSVVFDAPREGESVPSPADVPYRARVLNVTPLDALSYVFTFTGSPFENPKRMCRTPDFYGEQDGIPYAEFHDTIDLTPDFKDAEAADYFHQGDFSIGLEVREGACPLPPSVAAKGQVDSWPPALLAASADDADAKANKAVVQSATVTASYAGPTISVGLEWNASGQVWEIALRNKTPYYAFTGRVALLSDALECLLGPKAGCRYRGLPDPLELGPGGREAIPYAATKLPQGKDYAFLVKGTLSDGETEVPIDLAYTKIDFRKWEEHWSGEPQAWDAQGNPTVTAWNGEFVFSDLGSFNDLMDPGLAVPGAGDGEWLGCTTIVDPVQLIGSVWVPVSNHATGCPFRPLSITGPVIPFVRFCEFRFAGDLGTYVARWEGHNLTSPGTGDPQDPGLCQNNAAISVERENVSITECHQGMIIEDLNANAPLCGWGKASVRNTELTAIGASEVGGAGGGSESFGRVRFTDLAGVGPVAPVFGAGGSEGACNRANGCCTLANHCNAISGYGPFAGSTVFASLADLGEKLDETTPATTGPVPLSAGRIVPLGMASRYGPVPDALGGVSFNVAPTDRFDGGFELTRVDPHPDLHSLQRLYGNFMVQIMSSDVTSNQANVSSKQIGPILIENLRVAITEVEGGGFDLNGGRPVHSFVTRNDSSTSAGATSFDLTAAVLLVDGTEDPDPPEIEWEAEGYPDDLATDDCIERPQYGLAMCVPDPEATTTDCVRTRASGDPSSTSGSGATFGFQVKDPPPNERPSCNDDPGCLGKRGALGYKVTAKASIELPLPSLPPVEIKTSTLPGGPIRQSRRDVLRQEYRDYGATLSGAPNPPRREDFPALTPLDENSCKVASVNYEHVAEEAFKIPSLRAEVENRYNQIVAQVDGIPPDALYKVLLLKGGSNPRRDIFSGEPFVKMHSFGSAFDTGVWPNQYGDWNGEGSPPPPVSPPEVLVPKGVQWSMLACAVNHVLFVDHALTLGFPKAVVCEAAPGIPTDCDCSGFFGCPHDVHGQWRPQDFEP